MNDWRDMLRQYAEQNPDLPEGEEREGEEETGSKKDVRAGQGKLAVRLERKGRGGKTVTLVSGWTLDDDEVGRVAAELRKRLGTGGSVTDGEIMVQGDRRQQVKELLVAMGFRHVVG